MHAGVAVSLAVALTLLINLLALQLPWRWDLSSTGIHELSRRTHETLGRLSGRIRLIAFFERDHVMVEPVRHLLEEYRAAALSNPDLTLDVIYVDPRRDLAMAEKVARDYETEMNVIVIDADGASTVVTASQLVQEDIDLWGGGGRRLIGFQGEGVISSALWSVTRPEKPCVYVTAGHGERQLTSYHEQTGYSGIARKMRMDNLSTKSLMLAEAASVPGECAVLMIAGPTTRFAVQEIRKLEHFLARGGRIMMLLDRESDGGLSELTAKWGIELTDHLAVGWSLTGRELVVNQYGDHPVARHLRNTMTIFTTPRALRLTSGTATGQADRPVVTALAMGDERSWEETDPLQAETRPQFDEGKDLPGPVVVAASAERGASAELEGDLPSARIVVIGDSHLVANQLLDSAVGGNGDFFMNALNWLLERDALMGVAPQTEGILRVTLPKGHWRGLSVLMGLVWPGLFAALGVMVCLVRRV